VGRRITRGYESKGDGKEGEDVRNIQGRKKYIIFHIIIVGLYTGSNN
jgi:hypothetical protein